MPSVQNLTIKRQHGYEATTYYASWDFQGSDDAKNTLDHYKIGWSYDLGDGVWFTGQEEMVTYTQSTYDPPTNTIRISVWVTPIAKTHTVNNTEVYYWNGTGKNSEYWMWYEVPETPSAPTVEVDNYKLTASLENISDSRTNKVQFDVYNGSTYAYKGVATVSANRAEYQFTVEAGGKYRVKACAFNTYNNANIRSDFSEFSSSVTTIPLPPGAIEKLEATTKTSARIEWSTSATAESYTLEYTTKLEYFDGSNQTSTVSSIKYTHYEQTGLESGNTYYFRVKAVNDQGDSAWSSVKSIVLGTAPEAPTTWSSTTTAVVGDSLNLYWVHNSEDGSSQTYAELELTVNGSTKTYTIKNSEDEDEKDKTSVYAIDTSKYSEGTTIQWRVRTAGVIKDYGEWSVLRTIDIYAPVTLSLTMTNKSGTSISTVTSFPFYISALAGPKTQVPVSYHLSIVANDSYTGTDQVGNEQIISAGQEIYSKYFDTSEKLLVEISAHSIDLQNGISYTVTCVVAMDSGLTKTASSTFKVNWADATYEPDAEIGVDMKSYCTYIRPFCLDSSGNTVTDVTLAVYRREFDGKFVEIGSELANGKNVYVTDPHPALDYARYRIVATSISTGAISYYDPPGYPIQCKSVIIQWDEEWSSFETSNSDPMEAPAWSGSLLELPYNIDVSDNNSIDVSLVEYIGREHPVSYYGTQLGNTSSWSMDVPITDKETLYALRRLAIYKGDVYAREPSGSGYWASVSVSFSQTHCEVVIPVTIELTRVEGGM